jgi:hypothetical protein
MSFRLHDADTTLKAFITAFLLVLTIGYAIGLFFVEHHTSFSSRGVQEQFLGNEDSEVAQEVRYAKSANEMFVFIHNHILSLALVSFAVGGIFYFSSLVSAKIKLFLVVEPLVATLTTFGGIVLVRYVSPVFTWLVLFSGASLFLCYSIMVVLIMKELWLSKDGAVTSQR